MEYNGGKIVGGINNTFQAFLGWDFKIPVKAGYHNVVTKCGHSYRVKLQEIIPSNYRGYIEGRRRKEKHAIAIVREHCLHMPTSAFLLPQPSAQNLCKQNLALPSLRLLFFYSSAYIAYYTKSGTALCCKDSAISSTSTIKGAPNNNQGG